ncbi:MAG: GGDEF domain-containing protein [Thermoleophilaceae bacterium]
MGISGGSRLRGDLRAVFSSENQFRGADIALARRFTRIGWLLAVVVAYSMFPFYPPTQAIGAVGWLVPAGFLLPTSALLYLLFKHEERLSFNGLLVTSYMGLGMVVVEQWLAGGLPAPYHELYPFMVCAAAAVHPPRRFLPFMAVMCAAVVLPELGRAAPAQIGDLVAELALWLGASLFVMAVMFNLRRHRAELQADTAEARELARVDALTELGNRLAFDETVTVELSRSERTGKPVSLLICDLDSFKEINDRHGHLTGDDCLRQVAAALRAELRLVDSAFRWGGDEFVVIVADTDAGGARQVSSRLERGVREACRRPDGAPLTISCGTAELRDGMTGQELLAAADLSLREHKQYVSQPAPRAPLR